MATNYKNKIPTSFTEALRMCKDYAKDKHNLSVERIADEMGLTPSRLYQHLDNGDMPFNRVRSYQHICRCNFVTQYMANGDDCILIKMPKGKRVSDDQMVHFNKSFSKALSELSEFYTLYQNPDEVISALTDHLENVAWHRANVERTSQPQLDFDAED
jgi:AraC-like DNA-binding protein